MLGGGAYSNASKYSKATILKVFSLLYSTNYTYIEISCKLNVDAHLATDIKLGNTHIWLKELYPEQYTRMKNRPLNRRILKTKPILISPIGEEITLVVSLTEFCKTQDTLNHTAHSSSKGIGKVIRGERLSYLGWSLK